MAVLPSRIYKTLCCNFVNLLSFACWPKMASSLIKTEEEKTEGRKRRKKERKKERRQQQQRKKTIVRGKKQS